MGVALTAYSNLQLSEHLASTHTEEDWDSGIHKEAFAYKGFERSFRGLAGIDRTFVMGSGGHEFIGGHCYLTTPETERRRCMDRSYGGYGEWRRMLARSVDVDLEKFWKVADREETFDLPFYEILNFADNEGTIGPEACRDLMEDFTVENRVRFLRQMEHGSWHTDFEIQAWDGMAAGVALAANNGLIEFS